GEEQLIAVALLVVVQRARDDVRARIEDARSPVHVEPPLGVVEGVGDRDRLRPRDSVHVGKLEADESDPVRFELPDMHGISRSKTDRKSTRLNSSHVKISYGGFCLK